MKFITKSLIGFALTTMVLTVAFRALLTYSLDNRFFYCVIFVSIFYGLLMFASGWFFGKRDHEFLPIRDIGFRYHLTTYLVCNLIGWLWFATKFNSELEDIRGIYLTVLVWGAVLLVHFIIYMITRKKSIKGLDKNDIFD